MRIESKIPMAYGDSFDTLSTIEQDLVTLAFGVDMLTGADAMAPSGKDHMIVDSWTSGMEAPPIYSDPIAVQLREAGAADDLDPEKVKAFIAKFELYDLPRRIKSQIDSLDEGRREYFSHMTEALGVMLRALDPNEDIPSFEERYIASTRLESVELVDAEPYRQALQEALDQAGYAITPDKTLRDLVKEWQDSQGFVGAKEEGDIDGQVVKERFEAIMTRLFELARENLFSQMDFGIPGYEPDLSDVSFEGFEFIPISNEKFTGSSAYQGGGKEAPELRGILEYNTDHPLTPTQLVYLVSHEAAIGHYFASMIQDLLWRAGKLPFEATLNLMCSPQAALHEGWAENVLTLIFGSKEKALEELEREFGVNKADLQIAAALDDLQAVGKHNVSILYQRDGKSLEEVREYVAEELLQHEAIVEKLAGYWTQHSIIGPMYGSVYGLGKRVVAGAIDHVGIVPATHAILQTHGRMMDIQTFREMISHTSMI